MGLVISVLRVLEIGLNYLVFLRSSYYKIYVFSVKYRDVSFFGSINGDDLYLVFGFFLLLISLWRSIELSLVVKRVYFFRS